MTRPRGWAGVIVALAVAGMAASLMPGTPASGEGAAAKQVRTAYSGKLPQMDGSHLTASVVEVVYGPGSSSPAHSHPCPVIGYVVEGSVRMQVKGEPEAIYKAGESFYEAPNGVHLVSANASDTEPAKFVAYFVCDRDTPLSVAAPEGAKAGGN